MKVSELIEELKKFPLNEDVSVAVDCDFAGMACWDIRSIGKIEEFNKGVLIKGSFERT